jgi:hypothetical protein
MFTKKGEVVDRLSVVSYDLVQSVDIRFVKDDASRFQKFRVNIYKFRAVVCTILLQLGHQMGSDNAAELTSDQRNNESSPTPAHLAATSPLFPSHCHQLSLGYRPHPTYRHSRYSFTIKFVSTNILCSLSVRYIKRIKSSL